MKKILKGILLFLPFCPLVLVQNRENMAQPANETFRNVSESKVLLGFKLGPCVPIGEFGEVDIIMKKLDLQKREFN